MAVIHKFKNQNDALKLCKGNKNQHQCFKVHMHETCLFDSFDTFKWKIFCDFHDSHGLNSLIAGIKVNW